MFLNLLRLARVSANTLLIRFQRIEVPFSQTFPTKFEHSFIGDGFERNRRNLSGMVPILAFIAIKTSQAYLPEMQLMAAGGRRTDLNSFSASAYINNTSE